MEESLIDKEPNLLKTKYKVPDDLINTKIFQIAPWKSLKVNSLYPFKLFCHFLLLALLSSIVICDIYQWGTYMRGASSISCYFFMPVSCDYKKCATMLGTKFPTLDDFDCNLYKRNDTIDEIYNAIIEYSAINSTALAIMNYPKYIQESSTEYEPEQQTNLDQSNKYYLRSDQYNNRDQEEQDVLEESSKCPTNLYARLTVVDIHGHLTEYPLTDIIVTDNDINNNNNIVQEYIKTLRQRKMTQQHNKRRQRKQSNDITTSFTSSFRGVTFTNLVTELLSTKNITNINYLELVFPLQDTFITDIYEATYLWEFYIRYKYRSQVHFEVTKSQKVIAICDIHNMPVLESTATHNKALSLGSSHPFAAEYSIYILDVMVIIICCFYIPLLMKEAIDNLRLYYYASDLFSSPYYYKSTSNNIADSSNSGGNNITSDINTNNANNSVNNNTQGYFSTMTNTSRHYANIIHKHVNPRSIQHLFNDNNSNNNNNNNNNNSNNNNKHQQQHQTRESVFANRGTFDNSNNESFRQSSLASQTKSAVDANNGNNNNSWFTSFSSSLSLLLLCQGLYQCMYSIWLNCGLMIRYMVCVNMYDQTPLKPHHHSTTNSNSNNNSNNVNSSRQLPILAPFDLYKLRQPYYYYQHQHGDENDNNIATNKVNFDTANTTQQQQIEETDDNNEVAKQMLCISDDANQKQQRQLQEISEIEDDFIIMNSLQNTVELSNDHDASGKVIADRTTSQEKTLNIDTNNKGSDGNNTTNNNNISNGSSTNNSKTTNIFSEDMSTENRRRILHWKDMSFKIKMRLLDGWRLITLLSSFIALYACCIAVTIKKGYYYNHFHATVEDSNRILVGTACALQWLTLLGYLRYSNRFTVAALILWGAFFKVQRILLSAIPIAFGLMLLGVTIFGSTADAFGNTKNSFLTLFSVMNCDSIWDTFNFTNNAEEVNFIGTIYVVIIFIIFNYLMLRLVLAVVETLYFYLRLYTNARRKRIIYRKQCRNRLQQQQEQQLNNQSSGNKSNHVIDLHIKGKKHRSDNILKDLLMLQKNSNVNNNADI